MQTPTTVAFRARNQRGVALAVTLMGIVVLGGLIAGVFMTAVLENRSGQNSRQMEQAFQAAEHGLTQTLATWNVGTWNVLAVMDSAPVQGTLPSGSRYAGVVKRLNPQLFLVDITGSAANDRARQRIGTFVKLRNLQFEIGAALTTRGPSKVGGNATVDGADRLPPGWTGCPAMQPPKAGIRIPDAGDLNFVGGCGGGSCVSGDPKVDADPSVDDDTFFEFEDADWATLRAMATKRLSGGNYQNIGPRTNSDGSCNTGHRRNWGDPVNSSNPCGMYVPVIHVDGDLTVNTGAGQGLLLVDGNLAVQGGFEFYGIVVVRGQFTTTGTGNKIVGGLLAANVLLDDNSVLGTVDLGFSSCAVQRAQQAGASGAPLRSRSWMQLF